MFNFLTKNNMNELTTLKEDVQGLAEILIFLQVL